MSQHWPRAKKQFYYKTVKYIAFPEHGTYFGVKRFGPARTLYFIAMLDTGEPDANTDGEMNVGDVATLEDDQNLLNKINATFHTKFTMDSFPGR